MFATTAQYAICPRCGATVEMIPTGTGKLLLLPHPQDVEPNDQCDLSSCSFISDKLVKAERYGDARLG